MNDRLLVRNLRSVVLALGVVAVLGGCGKKEKAASQVAAKVNKEEISVHQINYVLQRQAGLRPEQAEAAGKVVLERLIDQELAIQKAEEQKLDREPAVLQMMEAAKREVIARAYQDRVAESAARPTDDEIKSYFDSKPALFKERRVYQIQELAIEVAPEKVDGVRQKLQQAKSLNDITDHLKANDIKYTANQAVRAAEQLPLNLVDSFSQMTDGQIVISPRPNGLQAIILAGSRLQPVTLEQAKPAIEQYILNGRKRELVEKAIKELRSSAKIEYVGSFAEAKGQPPAAGPATAASGNATTSAAPASDALDASTITKGMGLK